MGVGGTQEDEIVFPTVGRGEGLKGGKSPLRMTAMTTLGVSLQKLVLPRVCTPWSDTPGYLSPCAHMTGWHRPWGEDYPQSS